MTAVNKAISYKCFGGRTAPIYLDLPVQAGSTQAIKQGEICKLRDPTDYSTYPIIPVSASDTGAIFIIACEEQAATDEARLLRFALCTADVAFEIDLDSATQVKMGDKIALNGSQSVTVSASNTVGAAVATPVNATPTWQSVSSAWVCFGLARAEAVKYFPFAGQAVSGTLNGLDDMDDVGSIAYTAGKILVADGDSYEEVAVSGDVTLSSAGAVTIASGAVENSMLADKSRQWVMHVMGTLGIDNDGANTNGAGLHGGSGVTLTEQAAALCKVLDGSSYANLAAAGSEAGYTSNYQLLPDAPAAADAVFFGGAVPFCELALDMSATACTYDEASCITWKYWDGSAWSALTIVQDGTDADDASGGRPFQQDGAISFIPPSDWASTTVDSQAGYWIKAEVAADKNDNITQVGLTNSKEHELVTVTDPFLAPNDGTISAIRIADFAGTLHTAADVKFLLINLTTGAHTGELTFSQDQATDFWSGLSLEVSDGDELGLLITQEDGTNEVTNAALELEVTLS
jgi:hypothetical protein